MKAIKLDIYFSYEDIDTLNFKNDVLFNYLPPIIGYFSIIF